MFIVTHADVAQWSRRLPPKREVVSSNPAGHLMLSLFFTFFGLLTDIKKMFTEIECLSFRSLKKHLPKHSVCFPMKYHIKHIDLQNVSTKLSQDFPLQSNQGG